MWKYRILSRAPGRERRASGANWILVTQNKYLLYIRTRVFLSLCLRFSGYLGSKYSFPFSLSIVCAEKMNPLSTAPNYSWEGAEWAAPMHASALRYMIYFISFNVLTQGAGMGCECCCHCFIRHVKTSSHRNKLLSQPPGLITPRHSSPGEQGRRGERYS